MKYPSVIVIATIGLLTLQYSEARFLNFGILENIGNTLENIKDKIKDRYEQKWGHQVVTQPSLVFGPPSPTAAELPDFHFPEEEAANLIPEEEAASQVPEEGAASQVPEVTTVKPEDTTASRRLIEVPLVNGGCSDGYRRVGNRCREVFSGR